jgi:hypothetical protein
VHGEEQQPIELTRRLDLFSRSLDDGDVVPSIFLCSKARLCDHIRTDVDPDNFAFGLNWLDEVTEVSPAAAPDFQDTPTGRQLKAPHRHPAQREGESEKVIRKMCYGAVFTDKFDLVFSHSFLYIKR